MINRLRAWLIRMSDVYPPRWWWPVVRIYGGPDGQAAGEVYMTRVMLGPNTPWGRCYLHFFHRADVDRDPHDHPFNFWTFPINKGYTEEVYHHAEGAAPGGVVGGPCFDEVRVPPRRWTFRHATHTHRVDRTDDGRWPLVTLVWRSTTKRSWGFWCHDNSWRVPGMPPSRFRRFVPWKSYVWEGQHANEFGEDVMCPGARSRGTLRRAPTEGPTNA